jgi:hypothetical protein
MNHQRGLQALARSLAILVGVTLFAACSVTHTNIPYTEQERHRRVVDKITGEGIAGAFVVFSWDRHEADIGHGSRTLCVQIEVAKTGADGSYTVPQWHGYSPMIHRIYKPLYTWIYDEKADQKGMDLLSKLGKTGQERGEELTRMAVRCTEDQDRKMLELYQALYEELKASAGPKGVQPNDEAFFLGRIESAQFGYEEASMRAQRRMTQRGLVK